MAMQAYCIILLKLNLQRRFQNLAEGQKLVRFAKIVNSFKIVGTFLDNHIRCLAGLRIRLWTAPENLTLLFY